MQERKVTVKRERGIHLRPAQEIVRLTSSFACDVFLQNSRHKINAKSIMGVIGLAAASGHVLTIITDGPDEVEAMNSLYEMIDSGFPDLKEEE
jgi:phosphotransferase system HPr (HPr) family protein